MPLSPGLFLLLLSGLQAGAPESHVRALVGSSVRLGCVFPGGSSFDLNDLFVYWQISGSGTVVAYYLSRNDSEDHVDGRYRSRAHLSLDSMRRGDFSLLLRDVSPDDAQKFSCLVFRKSLEMERILGMEIRLHVAANFSVPVVSSPTRGRELTFTCTSTDGYPRPNVYWINKTDNSVLAGAPQNHTVSVNARGLYDVVSVLTLPLCPGVDVGCCVENALLSQNLTGSSRPGDRAVALEGERSDQAAQSLCPGHRPGSEMPPAGPWTQLQDGLRQAR
ncbi:ICOS ligand isoform X2 [Perognathus longimembris pacificus]|uniref:ICOS ligand isoform X2 n=1 Tax=Perognathus longimembris pacificus TaxID=214514 RepID=UPI002018C45E|nr:ICOS ligand isoform X2 [Perognathus longimembris pacificus]